MLLSNISINRKKVPDTFLRKGKSQKNIVKCNFQLHCSIYYLHCTILQLANKCSDDGSTSDIMKEITDTKCYSHINFVGIAQHTVVIHQLLSQQKSISKLLNLCVLSCDSVILVSTSAHFKICLTLDFD
jgi:hypothetical protein